LNELQQEGDGIGLHTPGSIRLIEKGNEARYLEAKQQVTYNSFIHSTLSGLTHNHSGILHRLMYSTKFIDITIDMC